ncbi:hypothetical protein WEZ65_12570, partial [Staphylococcus aureus]
MLKTSAVISNTLLVIGLVCLFMMKLVLAHYLRYQSQRQ